MGTSAVTGAMLQCSFGLAPSTLMAMPMTKVLIEGRPAAVITDTAPLMNISSFGMCSSLANPQVASATSAALGVLTPMPCVPAVTGPWAPGASRTLIGGKPALTSGCTANCTYGGVISLIVPGAIRTLAN